MSGDKVEVVVISVVLKHQQDTYEVLAESLWFFLELKSMLTAPTQVNLSSKVTII